MLYHSLSPAHGWRDGFSELHTASVYPQRRKTCTGRACNVSVYCVCLKALQLYFNLSTDYKDKLIKMRWRCTNRYLKQVGEFFLSLPWNDVSGYSMTEPPSHAEVLQPPSWFIFSSWLKYFYCHNFHIFTVITFTFTFQSQVFLLLQAHLCLPPDLSPEHPIYHLDWRSLYTLKGQWGWKVARACCRMENKGKKCTYP